MTYPQVPATTQRSYANQVVPSVAATGLTGATAASRYAGATTSGAPLTGTFAVGDYVIDKTGTVWICTTAGTPGTWTTPRVNDPLSLGYVTNAYPYLPWSALNPGSQTIVYSRLTAAGYPVSHLSWYVGTSSGNLNAGIYSGNGIIGPGAAPTALQASTGSTACGTTKQTVALSGSYTPQIGDWLALVLDNTTATIESMTFTEGVLVKTNGYLCQQVTSGLSLPGTPSSLVTTGITTPVMAGS